MIDNKWLQTLELFNFTKITFSSPPVDNTWRGDKAHQHLDEDNLVRLRELEAVHPDIFVQTGHPGNDPWSQFLQGDGSTQICFYICEPLRGFLVYFF